MTLLAEIMTRGFSDEDIATTAHFPKELGEPVAIRAHEIARSWFEDMALETNIHIDMQRRLDGLPLRPPFPCTWIEWDIPLRIQDVTEPGLDWLTTTDGAFVIYNEQDETTRCLICCKSDTRPLMLGGVTLFSNGTLDSPDNLSPLEEGAQQVIDAMLSPVGKFIAHRAYKKHNFNPDGLTSQQKALAYFMHTGAVQTITLALRMFHVKNMEIVADRPAKRSKKQRRVKPEQRIKWHTIKVRPQGKQYRHADGNSLPTLSAMHLVRGHFKTYSAERPLFGKYVGTYWHQAHTRGNIEAGEVAKDYEVAA